MSAQEEQAQQALIQRQRQQIAIAAQRSAALFQRQTMSNNQTASTEIRNNQMGTTYDDVPMQPGDEPASVLSSPDLSLFLSACRNDDLRNLQGIVSSERCTPRFLVEGLSIALSKGNVEIAHLLLKAGTPISRALPPLVLTAPADKRISLFEALTQHGWTANTPGFYGEVLLPKVISTKDGSLIDWFLAQKADPNLGCQKLFQDRLGEPDKESCDSLETAARTGNVDLARKLLDAGAKVSNGAPLYCAAGVCPPGSNPYQAKVEPTSEFDISMIPVMELLVSSGAGVNDRIVSRHMVPPYPLEVAIMAGAIQRVKWLLKQGANSGLEGYYGRKIRDWPPQLVSDGMKAVLAAMQEEAPVQASEP
ncbi:uncharacterized protein FIESC28_02851 [Fusarium coffeatum]|uniref:Uncharacterized protein n=1 Tax=Fusarium coffeatum TaxID=231269 RepID=A0A366S4V0_9HYPO|nr:uncharacterized protein FIESC28_02851 [Fusarium coffeatum]RBR24361.1 hypothetical protein FIESC28_02851 [Fusarium coffeatum]